MSYRFLPWVRRGLAAEITDADPVTADPPARARFHVSVAVSTGDAAAVDLRLYGPGDVIGIDPRAIIRTEPRRFARNFPPDHFAALEFDPPDFPWLFTPVSAGDQDRLRPWLALIVVEKQAGVSIRVLRDRPLPQLSIEPPAVPASELPDLSESWAWAHAHVVEGSPPASVPDRLRSHPDLNVSRLLCPRRLVAERDYYACLVPAFEVGRVAGLGQQVPEVATAAPAWGAAGGVGASITLPLYFHWEFRTGIAGDFEALARRLTPRPVPDTVGRRRMYVGAAHPALPRLPADQGGIVELEGALRSPAAGTGAELAPELRPWVEALVDILNAPAEHVQTGASADAEAVAPPVYGGDYVKVHTLDDDAPRWLGELNSDPRHRTAAGLGTEIVRINQERFMQAAWVQVGDVLAANALIDRARFLQQVAQRIHDRHVAPLGPVALLALTAPVHERVVLDQRVLARVVDRSVLPSGVLGAAFRRMASPRSPALTRAARGAGLATATVVPPTVVSELARGARRLDLLAQAPDGLEASRLIDRFPARVQGQVGPELGTVGSVAAKTVTDLRGTVRQLRTQPVPGEVRLRPDLAISGVVLARHVETIRESGAPVSPVVASVLETARTIPGAIGFRLGSTGRAPRAPRVEALEQPARDVITARLPGREPIEVGGALDGVSGIVLDRPITDRGVVSRFVDAFEARRWAVTIGVDSVVPTAEALSLGAVKNTLVTALEPGRVIEARARLAVQVRGRALLDGVLDGLGPILWQREPLDPVMVGPLLPEPLYRALAKADPDRFLPGVGEIPDDTVTMLETNPPFIEAFLVGANHELNRELVWRRYPTDKRGTPFHRFWDRLGGEEDIGPIHQFRRNAGLGANGRDDLRGSLVLLVRGQLLRRYPNAAVYAVPARADGSLDPSPAAVKNPIFWGRLDPDVTFVGFDLTREDIEAAPGWYFVIAEQVIEPTFGFDTPLGQNGSPATWSDVDWGHLGVPPSGYLRLASSPLNGVEKPILESNPARARFGRNSADMAAITFQRPFRAAIHSSKVIAGVSPPSGTEPVRPILTHAVLLRPIARDASG